MPINNSSNISSEGSDYANQKDTNKLSNITERFDDTTHNDNPYDDAIQYIKKKVDEVIAETNVQTLASGSYATDIKALTIKNSPTVKVHTLVMSVDRSNNLVISSGAGDSQITWTIAADER